MVCAWVRRVVADETDVEHSVSFSDESQRPLMEGRAYCTRSMLPGSPCTRQGFSARVEALVVRYRARDHQVHTVEPRNFRDYFIELQGAEQGVVEVRNHADYDFISPRRLSLQ